MPRAPSAEIDLSSVALMPLRVRRGRFETAVSLLNRQSIRSGYPDMDHLLRRVPGLPRKGRYTMPHLVAIAARVNGCDERELAASSVARVGSSFEIGGASVLSGRAAIQGRVCVGCLREDAECAPEWRRPWSPFLRDWWQVAQVASCPRHLMPLIGSCPACGDPIDMRRPAAARCRCGSDLLAIETEPMIDADVRADAYLLGRIERGPSGSVPLLDALSFGSAAGLMLNLGVSLDPGVPFRRTWNPDAVDRSRHSARGLEALSQGWEGLDATLSSVREISCTDRHTLKLVGRYGRLQHWLNMDRSADLDPFRDRMVDHARRNGAASDSTVFFGARLIGAERTTMNAAARIIGRHPGPIHRMLKALGLADQATGGARHDLVATAVLPRVKQAFDDAMDSAAVRARLGCNKNQLASYVGAGVLEEFCPGEATSAAFFRREDVERVAGILVDPMTAVEEVLPNTVLLSAANGIARVGDEAVTRAIVDGRVRAVAIRVGVDGVRCASNVLVSRSDVMRLRRASGRPYTFTEAAPLLRLHRFTLGKLCGAYGLGRTHGMVDASDLRAIRARFVTLREVVAAHPRLGRQERILAQLVDAGLRPAVDHASCQVLFNRAEVVGLVGPVPEEALPPELTADEQRSR